MNLAEKRVAVLGAGKMGGILVKAFLEKNLLSPALTTATVQHEERASALSKKLGIPVGTDNAAAAKDADIVFICVKPQAVAGVAEEIRSSARPEQLVISVAASVPTSQIENALGSKVPVVRAMPNTPCVIGLGMTALCKGQHAAQTTLGAAGVVLETGDHPALLKDAVTTPAGCTIDGILELEEGKLRVTLIKAVVKAAQRAKELAYSG